MSAEKAGASPSLSRCMRFRFRRSAGSRSGRTAPLSRGQRTVENRGAAIMRKTGSKSLPALARRALGLA